MPYNAIYHIIKHGPVRPVYKKDSRNEKQNYRPVSILSNLSISSITCPNKIK